MKFPCGNKRALLGDVLVKIIEQRWVKLHGMAAPVSIAERKPTTTPSGCACHPSGGGEYSASSLRAITGQHTAVDLPHSPPPEGYAEGGGVVLFKCKFDPCACEINPSPFSLCTGALRSGMAGLEFHCSINVIRDPDGFLGIGFLWSLIYHFCAKLLFTTREI